jgi:DNA (cytosine-5)-methyltransferase 1
MSRPLLLDLFCGAGGAAVGYHRAGFRVVGVDLKLQPRYPFEFYQADVMDLGPSHFAGFDVVHASPPCQAYSSATKAWGRTSDHPDLYGLTRQMLLPLSIPWVIENVQGGAGTSRSRAVWVHVRPGG